MRSLIACTLLTVVVFTFRPACCHATSKLVQRSFAPKTLAELQHEQRIITEASRAAVWHDSRLPNGRGGLEFSASPPDKWAVDAQNNKRDRPPTLDLFPSSPERPPLASTSSTALEELSETQYNLGAIIAEHTSKRPRIASVPQNPQHPESIDDRPLTAPDRTGLSDGAMNKQHFGSSSAYEELRVSQRSYSMKPKAPVTLNLLHSKSEEMSLNRASSNIHPQRPSDSQQQSTAVMRSSPFQHEWVDANIDNLRNEKPPESKDHQGKEERLSSTSIKKTSESMNSPIAPDSSGNIPKGSISRVNRDAHGAITLAASRAAIFKVTEPHNPQVVEQLINSYPSLMLGWKPQVICKKASCAASFLANELLRGMTDGPSYGRLQMLHNSNGIIIPFTYNLILKDLTAQNWEMVKIVWRDFWDLMEDMSSTAAHTDQETEILRDFLWISEFITECTIPRIFPKIVLERNQALESQATGTIQAPKIRHCFGLSQVVKALSAGHGPGYVWHKQYRIEKLKILINILRHEHSTYHPIILKDPQYSQAFEYAILEKLRKMCIEIQVSSFDLQAFYPMQRLSWGDIERLEKVVKGYVFRDSYISESTIPKLLTSIPELIPFWGAFLSQLSGPLDKRATSFSAGLKNIPRDPNEMLQKFLEIIQPGVYKGESYLPGRIHNFIQNYHENSIKTTQV